jgi:hypothetical protein
MLVLVSILVFALSIWIINSKYGVNAPSNIVSLTPKSDASVQNTDVPDTEATLLVAPTEAVQKKVKVTKPKTTKTKKVAAKSSTKVKKVTKPSIKVKKPRTKKPKA